MAKEGIHHARSGGLPGEYFQPLADLLPVIMWRMSADHGESWVNRAWSVFTGVGRDEEAPARWLNLVHPRDRGRVSSAFDMAFLAQEPINLSYRLRRHDGEFRWMSVTGIPVYREELFGGFLGVCLDVHRQRRNADLVEGFRLSLGELLMPDREASGLFDWPLGAR